MVNSDCDAAMMLYIHLGRLGIVVLKLLRFNRSWRYPSLGPQVLCGANIKRLSRHSWEPKRGGAFLAAQT